MVSRGVDVDGAGALLASAPEEFDKILTALEFGGDADLNITLPEAREKTLIRIRAVRDVWDPMKAAAARIADGSATAEDVNFVLTQNMAVLDAAVELVPELVKQYANPNAVSHATLLQIDISGRQRMLTQKMSKEACIMGTEFRTETTASDLEGTMGLFDASLNALRFGMPELSLPPPPTDEISAGLEVVLSDWTSVMPMLESVAGGQGADATEAATTFQQLNATLANMNAVVGMYTAATDS